MRRQFSKNGKLFIGVLIMAILFLGYGLQNAQAQEDVIGPIIGPKVTPKLSKPARDLPPAPPPSGEEVNPLQDSAAPPGERKLKLHALESPLGAGNYRIQFRFTIGDVSGPEAKIYSRTFLIQDD